MAQQEVRLGHPYYMHEAIHQQPEAVAAMLEQHAKATIDAAVTLAQKRRIYLVGIGTSWHAALTAEHWFRHFCRGQPEAQAWHSFEFVAYPPPLSADDAAIIISHRGTKTYSFEALDVARERGALTIAITSTNPGPRIMAADLKFHTLEQERSAAFTVSYTAALAVLAQLAVQMGAIVGGSPAGESLDELDELPTLMQGVLDRQQTVDDLARRYSNKERYVFTGWGPNTAQAYEVALKIQETSYRSTEGFQVEQLLHGPFLATTGDRLMTLIAPPGPGYDRSVAIARAAAELGAPVWALTQEGDETLALASTETFSLPPVAEIWSPFLYILPLQLFSYYLSLANGSNPDSFRRDQPPFAAAMSHYSL